MVHMLTSRTMMDSAILNVKTSPAAKEAKSRRPSHAENQE
jgi:hypothetical protein